MKSTLRILLEIENTLSELIIHAAPATAAEVVSVRELARLRDRLDGGINRLMELRIEAATADLSQAAAALEVLQQDLDALDARLSSLQRGVEIAGKVVEALVGLLKLIVAA